MVGELTVSFSLRANSFQFDQWLMTTAANFVGPQESITNSQPQKSRAAN
jgi:hypothetical protein